MKSFLKLIPIAVLVYMTAYNFQSLRVGVTREWFEINQIWTRRDIRKLEKLVLTEYKTTGQYPENFTLFIRSKLRARFVELQFDPARDRWGTRYKLTPLKTSFKIISAGPDRVFFSDTSPSEDDIFQTVFVPNEP
ncbi:MAG: hypothetical protein SGI71_10945 [Verrucomicrobiota bacterium]|nr:hypothetical protein [Verrucomicrobiota bacterium]